MNIVVALIVRKDYQIHKRKKRHGLVGPCTIVWVRFYIKSCQVKFYEKKNIFFIFCVK